MAATWHISQMEDYNEGPAGPFEGESRVIFEIHWQCTDEEIAGGTTYHARVYSSHVLQPFSEGEPFVPWADVTEALAVAWLHDKMGAEEVQKVEDSVEAQLSLKITPITEIGLPWAEENE